MGLDISNLALPLEQNKKLEQLIRNYGRECIFPARYIFLEPGTPLKDVIYIMEGRTRHYMAGPDGTEKILYTLSDGWFFGEAPSSVNEPTGLFSKTEIQTVLYRIPLSTYHNLLERV